MKTYKTHEMEVNDLQQIGVSFIEGEFKDIIFTLGKIEFNENEDEETVTMSFEYDIVEGELREDQRDRFRDALGDLLVELIQEGAEKNDIVYSGGIE